MQNSNALARAQEQYGSLRQKWLATLGSDHPNAIWKQITQMVREEVWFKTIIRLREAGGHPQINPYIWEMFITGYGTKQSLAIRRLTDTGKDTASLARLVGDIRKNQHLLKREIVVGFDGTPMDLSDLQRKHFESAIVDDDGIGTLELQGLFEAEDAHKAFDRLRPAPMSAQRRPTDTIDESVLQGLEDALRTDAIGRVRARCDHYLAHADFREFVDKIEGPTFNDIHSAIASLVRVRQFLRGEFLNHSSGSIVPTPQPNHLRDLAKPLVPEFSDSQYRDVWKATERELESLVEIEAVRDFCVHPE